jgi:hypothetical protein
MSAVAGILSIYNSNSTDLVGEYQETILVRNSKGYNAGTTLFGLMSRLGAEPAENTEFNWFERDPIRREIAADGADATPPAAQYEADTIVMQETTAGGNAYPYLAAGHVLRNTRTGEYVRVTATPTTNTVSVLRAIDTNTAATLLTYTINDNDTYMIVTLGKPEGASPTQASYEEPTVYTNYVQTFNSTVEITNAFKANKLRSDAMGPLNDRRIQALEKISRDIELAYFFGSRQKIADSSKYVYLTGGLKDAIDRNVSANALNGGGTAGIAIEDFKAWLRDPMSLGSDQKLFLCGPLAYSAISDYANQAVNGFRITQAESVFGMNITVIQTPFGSLDLAMHPLFREISSLQDWGFLIDLAFIKQKTMEPLFLEPNVQLPGDDSYKEQYRAKLGLKLKFANAFAYASSFRKLV